MCRGGPACPPVLVKALYTLWADTQVRPYMNHINTTTSPINRCDTSICMVTRFAVLQQSHRLQHRVLVVVERLGDVEGRVL